MKKSRELREIERLLAEHADWERERQGDLSISGQLGVLRFTYVNLNDERSSVTLQRWVVADEKITGYAPGADSPKTYRISRIERWIEGEERVRSNGDSPPSLGVDDLSRRGGCLGAIAIALIGGNRERRGS